MGDPARAEGCRRGRLATEGRRTQGTTRRLYKAVGGNADEGWTRYILERFGFGYTSALYLSTTA